MPVFLPLESRWGWCSLAPSLTRLLGHGSLSPALRFLPSLVMDFGICKHCCLAAIRYFQMHSYLKPAAPPLLPPPLSLFLEDPIPSLQTSCASFPAVSGTDPFSIPAGIHVWTSHNLSPPPLDMEGSLTDLGLTPALALDRPSTLTPNPLESASPEEQHQASGAGPSSSAGAIVTASDTLAEAEEEVDRVKHPSGIVPVLQNVVATVTLGVKLDLKQIALKARNAEFNPKVQLDVEKWEGEGDEKKKET